MSKPNNALLATILPRLAMAGSVAAYFLFFTAGGLRAGFTHDDLMNLCRAVEASYGELLGDVLLFFRFSPNYRPVGAWFYRLLFDRFGFDPLPLHIGTYALMLANIGLAYTVTRRLSGSSRTGALAAILHAYHGEFSWLYVSTGMCYDVLCFFFYQSALLYYLWVRERRSPLGPGQLGVWSGLYILCLNSKEMAVSLPVMIGFYELLYHPKGWRERGALRWLMAEGRVPLIGGILTLVFILGRLSGPDALPSMDAYRPVIRAEIYFDRAWHFLWFAVYRAEWMTPVWGASIMGGLALAALRGSPAMRYGFVWMLIGILPVAFIPQRGLDAIYIPLVGLALCLAEIFTGLLGLIPHRGLRAAGLAAGWLALAAVHVQCGRPDFEALAGEGRRIHAVNEQLRRALPDIPPQARVLFRRNPFPNFDWSWTFLMHINYRGRMPEVYLLDRLLRESTGSQVLAFDIVINYEQDRLFLCDPTPFRTRAVGEIANCACRPIVCPRYSSGSALTSRASTATAILGSSPPR